MQRANQHFNADAKPAKEINLREYFEIIRKRLWIILVVTVIAATGGYMYSGNNDVPLYETSTRIIIGSGEEGMDMNTLMVMITDPMIMETVKEDLQLSRSSDAIAGQIEVARIDDSQVVSISVTDQDPTSAMAIANSTAASFQSEIAEILNFEDVQLLSAAEENPVPINSSQDRTLMISIIFGFMTGIGLVFVLDAMDGTIRKESEVEEFLGVPVLGKVSNMNKRRLVSKKKQPKEVGVRGETVDIK